VIHHPWSATPLELKVAGVDLGKTYPRPIVDHKATRDRARTTYATLRRS
jgi:deoxyribodipyrimidine photo-lyase